MFCCFAFLVGFLGKPEPRFYGTNSRMVNRIGASSDSAAKLDFHEPLSLPSLSRCYSFFPRELWGGEPSLRLDSVTVVAAFSLERQRSPGRIVDSVLACRDHGDNARPLVGCPIPTNQRAPTKPTRQPFNSGPFLHTARFQSH